MIKINSIKWGLGVVALLSLGLSGCYFDEQRSEPDIYPPQSKAVTTPASPTTQANKAAKKSSASTSNTASKASSSRVSGAPVQQAAPGPKRAAAPALPVIQ